jgi:hypothetical protein
MKSIIPCTLLLVFAALACKKNEKPAQTHTLTPSVLTANNWRIVSVKNNVNPHNPDASAWVNTNFARKDTVINLYCVSESYTTQSYISISPCSYQLGGGTTVQVAALDCAPNVYYRDSTWSQLTRYDFSFKRGGTFLWVEEYNRSKFVNVFGKSCNPLTIVPPGVLKVEHVGTWSFDESTKTIKVDYGLNFSPLDGQTYNYFHTISYNGNEIVLRFQSRTATDYKLVKQ